MLKLFRRLFPKPLVVKIKPVYHGDHFHFDNFLPRRAHHNDACFDVTACWKKDLGDGRIEYGLGFAAELPEGYQMDLRPRSSVHKTGLLLSNCIGTLDEGYRGEYKAVFYKILDHLEPYAVGDRIGQIQLTKRSDCSFEWANVLSDSKRGHRGYGSTGR